MVPDWLCYPEVSDSNYPYTADGNREFLADAPFIDPFALCAALGAVTERLRFTTFVAEAADPLAGAGGEVGAARSRC